MFKHYSLFVLLAFLNWTLKAQCPPGDVALTSQAEVDAFLTNYPSCTSIAGELVIGVSFGTSNITDLSALSNLTSVVGRLAVAKNDDLMSLSGLDAITSVGGSLGISLSDGLTSLSGLDAITSIGGGLIIERNDGLTSLSGLDGLTSVDGTLYISINDGLTSLSSLENIDPIGLTNLYITSNPQLSSCAIANICTYLDIDTNTATILNNGIGCIDRTEVEMACNATIDGDLCLDALTIDHLLDQGIDQSQTSNLYNNTNNIAMDTPLDGLECQEDGISHSLWISFTGDGNIYRLTTIQCTAANDTYLFDTQMALYRGGCANLVPEACNSDQDTAQELYNAELIVETQVGVNYFLLLDGYDEITGEFCLEVTQLMPLAVTNITTTNIKVFPNPSNELAQFRNIVAESVTIFNSQGQRVAEYDTPTTKVDMSSLAAGVYYLSLRAGADQYSARVVKVD